MLSIFWVTSEWQDLPLSRRPGLQLAHDVFRGGRA